MEIVTYAMLKYVNSTCMFLDVDIALVIVEIFLST